MSFKANKKWVERNKKEFGVQIIELKKIINKQVESCGSSDEFTSNMLVALVSGRNKIHPRNSSKEINGFKKLFLK